MVAFTPMEEVEGVVKEVRVFFREVLLEEPGGYSILMEDLVVAEALVVYLEVEEVVVEGTLVEAVGIMMRTHVGEGEDLTTPDEIRKMTVVSRQRAMVMLPLDYCRNIKLGLEQHTCNYTRFNANKLRKC